MSQYSNLVAAIEARLALLNEQGGYSCNAGDKVWVNLEYATAPPEKPCLILYPGEVSDTLGGDTPPSQGEENHLLPIEIEGFILDDARGTAGQALRQDLLRLLKIDLYFGGLCEGVEGNITSHAQVDPAGKEGMLGFVSVKFTLLFVTLYGEE